LATELQLDFLISYDSGDQSYTNHSAPLRRTEDGVWWSAGSGGSISPEEDEVEFSIPAKVTDTEHNQDEPIDIADAIDDVFGPESDINEIKVATRLYYKDAKGNQKEIDLTIYTIKSSNGNADLRLSSAASERAVRKPQESDKVDMIKN
jgi:hypothetical protein